MSKPWLKMVLSLVFLLICSGEVLSKDWRGIVPMKSTREDVVRMLHQCKDLNPSCEFMLNDEFVHIEFSSDGKLHSCSAELKRDTVLLIEVHPKEPISLKRFGFDRRRFRTVSLLRTNGFLDEQRGVILKVERGKIVQIDYIAAIEDRNLCAPYYESPSTFIKNLFDSHVPVIYVTCPRGIIRAGEIAKISADIAGKPKITFLWSLSAGRIVSGQGMREITIDTSGLQSRTIVATVRLGRAESSCELQVAPN